MTLCVACNREYKQIESHYKTKKHQKNMQLQPTINLNKLVDDICERENNKKEIELNEDYKLSERYNTSFSMEESLTDICLEKGISQMIMSYLPMEDICAQQLSLSYIIKHKDTLDWFAISQYQYLPFNFIKEFQEYIVWYPLFEKNINIHRIYNQSELWKMCLSTGGCRYVSKMDEGKNNFNEILKINKQR